MSHDDGFTLLEILVALAILGGAFASFHHILGGSIHAVSAAEGDRRITVAAENILAEVGRSRPLQLGTTLGKLVGGQEWELKIEPASSLLPVPHSGSVVVYDIDLEIRRAVGKHGGTFAIHTLLLGSAR